MVEIELTDNSVTSTSDEDNLKLPKTKMTTRRPDKELVEKFRELIRRELAPERENFSDRHYEELMNVDSACTCWRYIEHCGRRLNEALELAKQTLIWRKNNHIDEPTDGEKLIKEFWLHAPITFSGVSKQGNDVLFVIGKNYRKPDVRLKPIIRYFTTTVLFNWDRRHQHDLDKFEIVFDVTDTGLRNIDLDYMAWLVSIRDYIPARISRISVVGIPFLIRPFIRMIISWLPENFRQIVQCGTFEQLVEANIDRDNWPVELGGSRAEETYRIAPLEVPWAADTSTYTDPTMERLVEEAIGFSVPAEKRVKLRQMQLDHERGKH